MVEDYRNTKYCSTLSDIARKKSDIKDKVLQEHPRAEDMHTYLSDTQADFKKKFAEAYNYKCAYCGVSVEIISIGQFEIDHFIPKVSARFGGSKAKAGYIENLILSCSYCNRAKSNFECSDEDMDMINPDDTEILKSFVRDDMYYIRISHDRECNKTIKEFYEKAKLGSQLRRIDYLLLNMYGLCKDLEKQGRSCDTLRQLTMELQKKRNLMGWF